ncbi:MAG: tRNA-dihydrouridine synthase family protein [Spirochaetaceae bacterium]
MDNLVLAPIKGYTDPLWRSCYFEYFSGIDKVVTPFLLLSEHNRAKKSYFPKFLPEIGSNIQVVPQFLAKDPETIIYASELMADLGITEFNLNMGCPAPAIYKKGRGSGLLNNLDNVKKILDSVAGKIRGDFTVKIRTGITDSSLVHPLLDILNNYPLKEVIVHPRFARQLYNGIPDMDAFDYIYNNSSNPVSYNGDIYTVDGFNRLKDKYENVSSWMLGRGVLRDPFLPSIIKTGIIPTAEQRKKKVVEFIKYFDMKLKDSYVKQGIASNRVKATLIYIAAFYDDSIENITAVKRAKSLDQILEIISLN